MFTLAGLLTALFMQTELLQAEGLTYTIKGLPCGLLLLAVFLVVLLLLGLIKRVKKKLWDIPHICKCTITLQNKVIHVDGFVDTGNRVQDSNGNFVIFIEKALLSKDFLLLPKGDEVQKELQAEKGIHKGVKNGGEKEQKGEKIVLYASYLEVQTVAGKKICSTFKIDALQFYYRDKLHIHKNVTVAVYEEKMAGEYGAILSPLCFV